MRARFFACSREVEPFPLHFLCELLFLSGALLGLALARISGGYLLCWAELQIESFSVRFCTAFWDLGKLFLLLFLFSCFRAGAILTPTLFAAEGFRYGFLFSVSLNDGISCMISSLLFLSVRLLIVFPCAFLVGSWSIRRCAEAEKDLRRIPVFVFSLFAAALSALLESTLAFRLGSIYLTYIGV